MSGAGVSEPRFRVVANDEPWLTRPELAATLRLGVRTVDRFRAEGMPCETLGLRRVLYKESEARRWIAERKATKAA